MRTFVAAIVLCLIAGTALAASAFEPMDGEAVRKAFEGNTVSGRYSGGGFFTEYHDDSGRALGNNGYEQNRDACWAIVTDAVCYYYGPPDKRTTHCFQVVKNDRLYILYVLGSRRINAVATIEPGNPRRHGDEGKPWICDGLVSQAPPISKRLLARR